MIGQIIVTLIGVIALIVGIVTLIDVKKHKASKN